MTGGELAVLTLGLAETSPADVLGNDALAPAPWRSVPPCAREVGQAGMRASRRVCYAAGQ